MNLEQKDFVKLPRALDWITWLFQDPATFTKGAMYRSSDGYSGVVGQDATKCCLLGAIYLASRDPQTRMELVDVIRLTVEGRRWGGISLMNDRGGLEAVQKALSQAMALHPITS